MRWKGGARDRPSPPGLTGFLPEAYRLEPLGGHSLHAAATAERNLIEPITGAFSAALAGFKSAYVLPPAFDLHLCVFETMDDSRIALGRQVSDAALLVPFANGAEALIACHSPAMNPQNADPRRMLRHFLHELGHVGIGLETGSTRCLGNGGQGMRIPEWVDEGLAEWIAFSLLGDEARIAEAIRYVEMLKGTDPPAFLPLAASAPAASMNPYKSALGKVARTLEGRPIDLAAAVRRLR